MKTPNLLAQYLEMFKAERSERPDRPSPRAMTLHCSTCDSRFLFDGNHGFTRISVSGNHLNISVTEMTSPSFKMRACQCEARI